MAVEILCDNKGKLDCRTCDDKLKSERGHDKDGIVPFRIDGKVVYRCPLMIITENSYAYIKAFNFYEKGFLPNGLSWMNEGNKLIQAIMLLDNEFSIQKLKEARK